MSDNVHTGLAWRAADCNRGEPPGISRRYGQRFTMSGPRGMRHGGALPLTVVDGDTSCNSKRLRQLCPGAVRAEVQRFEEE